MMTQPPAASFRSLAAGIGLIVLVLAALPGMAAAAPETPAEGSENPRYLAGRLLVATPRIGDPRFARTVIYMVSHDRSGAFGLVVNRAYGKGPMDKFLKGFNIDAGDIAGDIRLHYGGPVEPGAGFVLHTADYEGAGTRVVDSRMALTTGMGVLKAIAEGHGPRRSIFILGYAGWGPDQLEGEIARGDWLNAPADEQLIFDDEMATKWDRATGKAGLKL